MDLTPDTPFEDMNVLFHRYMALGMVRGLRIFADVKEDGLSGVRASLAVQYKTYDESPSTSSVLHAVAAEYMFHGLQRADYISLGKRAVDACGQETALAKQRARLKMFELLRGTPHDVCIYKDLDVIDTLATHSKGMQVRPVEWLLDGIKGDHVFDGSYVIQTTRGPIARRAVDKRVAQLIQRNQQRHSESTVQALFARGPHPEWADRGLTA